MTIVCLDEARLMGAYGVAQDTLVPVLGMCVMAGLTGEGMPPAEVGDKLKALGLEVEAVEDIHIN